MIKINRGNSPDYLQSEDFDLAFEKLKEFYSLKNRSQKRYDFPFNPKIDLKIKEHLHNTFHGKCGYCEIKIEGYENGIIDRFRPYDGVRDKNEYFQDLYWWLTFEWNNLIYSCKECNQYKANYFPVKSIRLTSIESSVELEKPLLLNPCKDSPEEHFMYDESGNINSVTEQGNQTIQLLRLDRTNLVQGRKDARKEVIYIIEELLQQQKSEISISKINYLKKIYYNNDPTIEFLAYKKWVLINEIENVPFLVIILGIEEDDIDSRRIKNLKSSSNNNINNPAYIQSDYFPIESIQIENFKSISNLTIDFKEDEKDKKSWLFLLGENGVGKSSILQAIALGLKSDSKIGKSVVASRLIQKGKQKSIITIKERNSDNIIKTVLTRKDNSIKQLGEFNSFLLGYGSLRLSSEEVSIKSRKNLNMVSYENLFDPILALNDITNWLKSTFHNDQRLFERIAYAIKQLLPHDAIDNELTIDKGEISFKNSDKIFSELSDGFKSTIILAVDIMMKLTSANSDFDKVSGVVIIDELGNQLHPRWQMRIVKQLKSVFPNINFIISTHHPLCLRGSVSGEILLLRNIEGSVEAIRDLPDPSSLRVDQLLSSEYFGLSSMIDPELEAKFNRYYKLLSLQKKISSKEVIELSELKDELRNKKHLGSSLREELMYSVIDNLLAQKVMFSRKIPNRETLKKEVIDRVKKIWSDLNIEINDQS